MRWPWAVSFGFVVACFRPSPEQTCEVVCGAGGACPSGLTCVGGLCAGSEGSCGSVDATTPDVADASDGSQQSDAAPGCLGGAYLPGFCPTLAGTFVYGPSGTINTDQEPSCSAEFPQVAGGTAMCVIAADTITIPTGIQLRFVGSRPILLVANTITVRGTLDVSSELDAGAGSSPGCWAPDQDSTGEGGGAGGTLGTKGGGGGQSGQQVAGGLAGDPTVANFVRGGCTGGTGSGLGGIGGGAIYLRARTIDLALGKIHAYGGPGRGTSAGLVGGGGGGSGGMIVLNATTITLSGATILATGGGGGGGGGTVGSGAAGSSGQQPLGGQGGLDIQTQSAGGNGGDGAAMGEARAGADGRLGTSTGGGGGGGGGGLIEFFDDTTPSAPDRSTATILP